MRYLPKSPAERQEMLAAIGVKSIDELFSSIPERFRLREALRIPGPYSEAEVIQYFKERAAENSNGYTSFLGAGVYNHLRSVVTDAIIQRGEFLTSYTPYQAEITQGTLQAIFEFQTLIDRKSTRLNSSHITISYAVFCLKKKKNKVIQSVTR